MDDELVYRKAEEFRDRDLFYAQDVADLLLESDVGGVLESLHRLVEQHRLVGVARATAPGASDDAVEYEGFKFPSELD